MGLKLLDEWDGPMTNRWTQGLVVFLIGGLAGCNTFDPPPDRDGDFLEPNFVDPKSPSGIASSPPVVSTLGTNTSAPTSSTVTGSSGVNTQSTGSNASTGGGSSGATSLDSTSGDAGIDENSFDADVVSSTDSTELSTSDDGSTDNVSSSTDIQTHDASDVTDASSPATEPDAAPLDAAVGDASTDASG